MSDDVIRLARGLIDIPSVTGGEGPISNQLLQILHHAGFPEAELQVVDGDRCNVLAFPDDVEVVLCTHMDTVGPFEPSSVLEGRLHGRGAVDAKGILAAMILAAKDMRAGGESRVGLLFLVGEEVDSIGARAANAVAPESRFVVVGEPTEGKLATAHKGGLAATLLARGEAGHSGYPEYGSSAIHSLLDGLSALRLVDWGSDPDLGEATVNVGTLEGGVAANVLAPAARAEVLIRLVGPAEQARSLFRSWAGDHPDISVETLNTADPMHFHTVPGFPTGVVAFGSDAPYLPAYGTPLLYGPGSIRQAHTKGEYVAIEQLRTAVTDYTRIAEALLNGNSGAATDRL